MHPAGLSEQEISLWQTFVHWFSQFIQFFYELTVEFGIPNYGLAIILITIVIKIVLLPLTQKQMTSMRAMQNMQPRIKLLQERYKDDPKTMQLKLGELYKEQGINPLGGCLPLLIQMPIFFAFYQSLYKFQFTEVAHAKFFWIQNIGQPDPWYILAVLVAGTTFLQQRISMANIDDPTQKTMLYVMPLMMGWITTTVPAGLPLYWSVFNVLGIIQQLFINRKEEVNSVSKEIKSQEESNHLQPTPTIEKSVEPAGEGNVEKGGQKNAGPSSRKKRKKR